MHLLQNKKLHQFVMEGLDKISDEHVFEISELTKEEHYKRNENQLSIPLKESDILSDPNWKKGWHYEGFIATHNLYKASTNKAYRGFGKNNHFQVVYNQQGVLVTDHENKGTYGFGVVYDDDGNKNIQGLTEHLTKDVIPWIVWGNTEADRTTSKERLEALFLTITLKEMKELSTMIS